LVRRVPFSISLISKPKDAVGIPQPDQGCGLPPFISLQNPHTSFGTAPRALPRRAVPASIAALRRPGPQISDITLSTDTPPSRGDVSLGDRGRRSTRSERTGAGRWNPCVVPVGWDLNTRTDTDTTTPHPRSVARAGGQACRRAAFGRRRHDPRQDAADTNVQLAADAF
jgi:hypothetical protein